MSILPDFDGDGVPGALAAFRQGFFRCLTSRSEMLFELTDALSYGRSPVTSLPRLSLEAVFQRGHGALYEALTSGEVDTEQLGQLLASQRLPRVRGLIVLAVDVTSWLRPDANCAPERLFCHVAGRGRSHDQMIPGWAYSFVAAVEPGRISWTQIVDAVCIGQTDNAAEVTTGQLRTVIERLIDTGQHRYGDEAIIILTDAGYDVPRLAWQLRDLPVIVTGRLRSDRVLYRRAPARTGKGRPTKHGPALRMKDPTTWDQADLSHTTDTDRYGSLQAQAWSNMHSRLTHRAAWMGHTGDLPILEGTLIRLTTERLPHSGASKPLWLWTSQHHVDTTLLNEIWSAWLRRFDIEHTFRFMKQTLGWNCPQIRNPHAADRWTSLVIAAYTQLRLARTLAADVRMPWEKPTHSTKLTPTRIRRDFPNLHPTLSRLTGVPKPSKAGPGRPKGQPNRHRAPQRHPGKKTKRDKTITQRKKRLKNKTP